MPTLDFAADLGADPSGTTSSSDALAALGGFRSPVECTVPDGEYLLNAETHALHSTSRITLRAAAGADPTLVAPADYSGTLLSLRGDVTLRGLELDRTASNCGPTIDLRTASTARLVDLTLTGRDDTQATGEVLTIAATSPQATVRIDGLQSVQGALAPATGAGRAGVRLTSDSTGTVNLRGCDIREYAAAGVDASAATGTLAIHGGWYVNNNDAQIWCGTDAMLHDTVCIVDIDKTTWTPSEADAHYDHAAGVRIAPRSPLPDSETVIRKSTMAVRSGSGSQTDPAVVADDFAGGLTVADSTLEQYHDGTAAILAEAPHPDVVGDTAVTLARVRCTGTAASGPAVSVFGREESVLSECAIDTPGDRRAYELPSNAEVSALQTAARTW